MISKYKVVLSDLAIEDAESILDYFDKAYFNELINDKFLNLMQAQIDTLSYTPEINRVRLTRNNHDIRVAIFMSYLMCYEIDFNNKVVHIIRIFHELEDYENKLIIH